MSDGAEHSIRVTPNNPLLSELSLSWRTAVFSDESGIGPMSSLHEAGDAIAAVAYFGDNGLAVVGSAVMVAPGLLLTATHVLDEIASHRAAPLFLTFLDGGTRAWLPMDVSTLSRPSQFEGRDKVVSDLSLVSCSLNSEALEARPLMLAPMQIALPLIGDRLWAMGFRQQGLDGDTALVTPLISSGLVVAAYPNGRGEHMVSPCFEVDMETLGGMSGGAVVNADGFLVGIVSSSWDGGPSYMTLIWDAVRLRVAGPIPKLQSVDRVSLLGARALGLAKIKGNVDRDPFGEVSIKLSDAESELMTASLPPEHVAAMPASALDDDELEEFLERWGEDLEDAALEGTLRTLNRQSLVSARSFLEGSDVPAECLAAVTGFTVEDFDGLEDITVTSTEIIDEARFLVHYYIDLPRLIWTVEMEAEFADANATLLDASFFNRQVMNGHAIMELVQRRFFRGSAIFDREAEVFTDTTTTLSAIKPRRDARKAR